MVVVDGVVEEDHRILLANEFGPITLRQKSSVPPPTMRLLSLGPLSAG